MVHKNCFVDNDNNYIWIDQEWCFNNIPASYILFHNIIELYSSNSWLNSYINIKDVLEHYHIADNYKCYFNVKNAILNTVQNQYSAFNYWQLSDFDYKKVENNILNLHSVLADNKNTACISETEQVINNLLENSTFDELISYINTLSDDIILKDIPDIPKFIVKYMNSTPKEQLRLNTIVRKYSDIASAL